jgi:hypothetical protein
MRKEELLKRKKAERKASARKRVREKENAAAATKIQARVRGNQVRSSFRKAKVTRSEEAENALSAPSGNNTDNEEEESDENTDNEEEQEDDENSDNEDDDDNDEGGQREQVSDVCLKYSVNQDEYGKIDSSGGVGSSKEASTVKVVVHGTTSATTTGKDKDTTCDGPLNDTEDTPHTEEEVTGAPLESAPIDHRGRDEVEEDPSFSSSTSWPVPLDLKHHMDVSLDTTASIAARGSIRVFVMTWNLQAHKPPSDLQALLRPGTCHVYAIGTQECVQTYVVLVPFLQYLTFSIVVYKRDETKQGPKTQQLHDIILECGGVGCVCVCV